MYCPKCGQQQVSDEMRFCSRCGLALSGLAEWLANGGAPLVKSDNRAQVDALSPRRKGIRRAAKLMFFSGVLVPVFLVISLVVDEGTVLLFPLLVFFVSLMMMLYARLFSDKTAPQDDRSAQTPALNSASVRSALPPATNLPAVGVGRPQVSTKEIAQPPSVTEHTTRLLDNE